MSRSRIKVRVLYKMRSSLYTVYTLSFESLLELYQRKKNYPVQYKIMFYKLNTVLNLDHCVETDGQSLTEFNCLNFSSGCPQEHHWSYEFYKRKY